MQQAPHTQQHVQFQTTPPTQHAPPMQQSSIHIPVGPSPTKVVSTATIVPTAYPTAPGNHSTSSPARMYHEASFRSHIKLRPWIY